MNESVDYNDNDISFENLCSNKIKYSPKILSI